MPLWGTQMIVSLTSLGKIIRRRWWAITADVRCAVGRSKQCHQQDDRQQTEETVEQQGQNTRTYRVIPCHRDDSRHIDSRRDDLGDGRRVDCDLNGRGNNRILCDRLRTCRGYPCKPEQPQDEHKARQEKWIK